MAAGGRDVKISDAKKLKLLIDAGHPCISIETHEEEHALAVIHDAISGRLERVWEWSCVRGVNAGALETPETVDNTLNAAAALCHMARVDEPCWFVAFDLLDHLDDASTRRALRELITRFRNVNSTMFLIDGPRDLPPALQGEVARLELSLPDAAEIELIVRNTLTKLHRRDGIDIEVTRGNFRTIIRNLSGLTRRQVEQVIVDACVDDGRFDREDINSILAGKRQRLHQGGLLEYVEAPLDLGEIGGLASLKQWLKQRERALTDQAADFGLHPPRGVLLLGVQGAGKSMSAKAIATAWNRPLLRLDPGSLYDRYVGESERRLRAALHQVEVMAPIVVWIDEIEKGFASAAAHNIDGGLSQRMFGTLLTWMQDHTAPVFLVATANNIDALPPELLRKGRFDEIFFVDLPSADVRKQIFAIHLRKRGRDPESFDLAALATASDGYSGAEIEQAVVAALHAAFAAGTDLDTEGVLRAVVHSPPLSVTMAESVARLREWARDRCVPAG